MVHYGRLIFSARHGAWFGRYRWNQRVHAFLSSSCRHTRRGATVGEQRQKAREMAGRALEGGGGSVRPGLPRPRHGCAAGEKAGEATDGAAASGAFGSQPKKARSGAVRRSRADGRFWQSRHRRPHDRPEQPRQGREALVPGGRRGRPDEGRRGSGRAFRRQRGGRIASRETGARRPAGQSRPPVGTWGGNCPAGRRGMGRGLPAALMWPLAAAPSLGSLRGLPGA